MRYDVDTAADDAHLVHQNFDPSVKTFCYRVVEDVFEPLFFTDNTVQKICHIYVGSLSR